MARQKSDSMNNNNKKHIKMNKNDIKFTPKVNSVGDMYTKVTGSNLIGQLMNAAWNGGKIIYSELNPHNITINVTGESLTFEFDVDKKVMGHIMANEPEWTISVLAIDDYIDFSIYQSAIDNGEITYGNGHFTITNDWIGAYTGDIVSGTYDDGYMQLVNTSDDFSWTSLTTIVNVTGGDIDLDNLVWSSLNLSKRNGQIHFGGQVGAYNHSDFDKFMQLEDWSVAVYCNDIFMIADVNEDLLESGDATYYSDGSVDMSGACITLDETKVTESSYTCDIEYYVGSTLFTKLTNLTFTTNGF